MTALPFQLQLPIHGMSCASCASRVERALGRVKDVVSAHVNLTTERAYIESDHTLLLQDLITVIEKTGFDVPLTTTNLNIEGMSCASCAARLERALQKRPDVTDATVNLATERASITGIATTQQLIETVSATGFKGHATQNTISENDEKDKRRNAEFSLLKRHLLSAAFLWGAIAALEMIPGVARAIGLQWDAILQFGLATLLLAWPGWRFFQHGFPALWRRAPEMNSLVAVGSLAAYLYSALATFAPHMLPQGTIYLYYEAAAGIVTLVLLGRFLEARAKGRTSEALRALTGLQAKTAHVLHGDTFQDRPIDDVTSGDIIAIRPGERLPVDGVMIEGDTWIDESMITGEPMPIAKKAGDEVIAGTVNQKGAFHFRATAVRGDTMLSHIITMVEQAQGSKLPIQSLVNAITRWFVPAIMSIALLTFIIWFVWGPSPSLSFALVNAVAVLIAACPCAMGLATPTAIMMGTGKGAELGILFRKGEALQKLEHSKAIALDKTGTLTEGRPTLTDFHTRPGFERHALLRLIAAVEARSEHPIAHALVQQAEKDSLTLPDVTDFHAVTGMGVEAKSEGNTIHIGSARYMHSLNIDTVPFSAHEEVLGHEGKSPLYAALNHKLATILAVADPIKATSKNAVTMLKELGLKVIMVTGDQAHTAETIARQLGIEEVVSNVLPEGKVDAIQRLQKEHGCVAFVGDGINDAPALAQADIGLAVGGGTDIALEAADVVLVNGQLSTIISALTLSRETLRIIKQNLFWAFAYNIILVPIAAGILYPLWGLLLSPMFAAGAMALSSVCVLTNTLRLRRFAPPILAQKENA